MGPKAPFERVVSEHGAMVLRVCRAVLGPTDAEDAWSETFLSALRAYPDLAPNANLAAWLVTIAHRRAIDVARASSRRATPVGIVPDRGGEDPAGEPDVTLSAAVAALPTKQRQCVAYHFLGGLSFAEIAAIVGGTEVAARRASADGIATLRRTVTEDPTKEHR
jgi:RNA polymerase sigma factor (sigma-70 family)